MKRLVDLLIAERTVIFFIVLNTAALFGLASYHGIDRLSTLCFYVDYCCVIYFIIEAALKIKRFGWSEYWASSWDKFDFVIVALSLPALLTPVVDLHDFTIVLVLRVSRLFRLFRMMQFIPNRVHLATGIKRALKTSIGIIIALVLVNVMLSIGASMLFGDLAPEYFGDPLLSIYSIFKVFTVEGWYEIPDLLASRAASPAWAFFARFYFVASVLVGGIIGLSLANAVFVDEMTMDNTLHLEEKIDQLANEIRELRDELRKRP